MPALVVTNDAKAGVHKRRDKVVKNREVQGMAVEQGHRLPLPFHNHPQTHPGGNVQVHHRTQKEKLTARSSSLPEASSTASASRVACTFSPLTGIWLSHTTHQRLAS